MKLSYTCFIFWNSDFIFLYEWNFLKISKAFWKHIFSNTIFAITVSFYKVRTRKKALFNSSLVRSKSQNTWYLKNNYTNIIYKIYKDVIKFKTEETENSEHRKKKN